VAVAALAAACGHSGTSKSEGAQVLQNLTPLEKTILADKNVSFGEYQLAEQDTVSCLRLAGFTVSDLAPDATGLLTFNVSHAVPNPGSDGNPDAVKTLSAQQDACQQRSEAVQAVYILEHAASEQQAKAAGTALVACLQKLGVTIPATTDPNDLKTVLQSADAAVTTNTITQDAENGCVDQYRSSSLQPLPGLADALSKLGN
jgi:hypothetical protein